MGVNRLSSSHTWHDEEDVHKVAKQRHKSFNVRYISIVACCPHTWIMSDHTWSLCDHIWTVKDHMFPPCCWFPTIDPTVLLTDCFISLPELILQINTHVSENNSFLKSLRHQFRSTKGNSGPLRPNPTSVGPRLQSSACDWSKLTLRVARLGKFDMHARKVDQVGHLLHLQRVDFLRRD